MIAGIIHGQSGQPTRRLREIIGALHSARVQELALVADDGMETAWFDGPVIRGKGTASLLAAVRALPQQDLHGVLYCPLEGPKLSQSLVVDLLQGFWRSGQRIILPTKGWRPVIIGTVLALELGQAQSLEEFVASHAGEIHRISAVAPAAESLEDSRA